MIQQHKRQIGTAPLCRVLGVSRATLYRTEAKRQAAPASEHVPQPARQSETTPLCPHPPRGPQEPPGVWAKPSSAEEAATAPAPLEEVSLRQGTPPATREPPVLVSIPRASPRGLSDQEKQAVLQRLGEDRFCDKSPAEVYATLLDEGQYLCSQRTMYRILADNRQLHERRRQRRHPKYTAPELLATRPNELWSWDITKLKAQIKCQYLHLYVILDVFSRYVVGWLVAEHESGELAKGLIEETCDRQGIKAGELTFHADNGAAMVSQPVGFLLASLGVTKSHSRPHVSDDNPYSESQFKTLKYRPDFPERFESLAQAREFLRAFFAWYNLEHHHEGLALLTPHDVHYGLAAERLSQRARVLEAAYAAHPERFVRRPPTPALPPKAVWINEPKQAPATQEVRV